MGLTDDWQRLSDLERLKGTLQYGQNLQVTLGPGNPDTVLASKDLIRWVGEKTDVNAWRVYLGPWQPRPNTPVPAIIVADTYADPTPWAPPEPSVFDSMPSFPCYARVMWGSGGIQHTAFVDWPKRGLLLQISGSYVQVNAMVNVTSSTPHNPSTDANLPLLQATLAPEPGGGDAANPATYTYPPAAAQDDGGAGWFQNFQIPPFARAFIPIINFPALVTSGGTLTISTQALPQPIGSIGNNDFQVWQTPIGGVYDQDMFTVDAIPIVGQQAGTLRIQTTPGAPGVAVFGVMFLLDL